MANPAPVAPSVPPPRMENFFLVAEAGKTLTLNHLHRWLFKFPSMRFVCVAMETEPFLLTITSLFRMFRMRCMLQHCGIHCLQWCNDPLQRSSMFGCVSPSERGRTVWNLWVLLERFEEEKVFSRIVANRLYGYRCFQKKSLWCLQIGSDQK